MITIDYGAQYFNPTQTLECGQIFRFSPYKEGYIVNSADKICYLRTDGVKTYIESEDPDYFYGYFDLGRDYSKIVSHAKSLNIPALSRYAEAGKGVRLLNQNREEMLYSFIVSQNNNIPRIKSIISRICAGLCQKQDSPFGEYYPFPASLRLSAAGKDFFKNAGAGYRDIYLAETSARVVREGFDLENLSTPELKKKLLTYKGVGGKVADCIALFGFARRESFPVDTWIEKVYKEDFCGNLTDRNKICEYFTSLFGEYSGYIQQYLFYGKRQNL